MFVHYHVLSSINKVFSLSLAVILDPLEVFKSGVVKLKENGLWQLCFDHKYVFYKVAQGMAIMEEDVFVNSCVG